MQLRPVIMGRKETVPRSLHVQTLATNRQLPVAGQNFYTYLTYPHFPVTILSLPIFVQNIILLKDFPIVFIVMSGAQLYVNVITPGRASESLESKFIKLNKLHEHSFFGGLVIIGECYEIYFLINFLVQQTATNGSELRGWFQ